MTERAKISSEHRAKRNHGAPDLPSTGSRKRNTRRWCKGVVGREHDYERRLMADVYGWPWTKSGKKIDVCKNCGRREWVFK